MRMPGLHDSLSASAPASAAFALPASADTVMALLPLIALASAMLMTPVFMALALALLWACGRREGAASLYARWQENPASWAILALSVGWCVPSALWSITPLTSFETGLRVVAMMVLGGALLACARGVRFTPRQLEIFSVSFAAMCVLISAELLPTGGVVRWVFDVLGKDFTFYLIKDINRTLCLVVLLLWPLMAGLQAIHRTRMAWAMFAAAVMPVVLLHSLSAKMALVLGFTAFTLGRRFPRAFAHVLRIAIPLAMLSWPLVFHTLDRPFFSNPAVERHIPESAAHRIVIWRFTLERIAEKPLLGWGMDTARSIPGGRDEFEPGKQNLPLHPHNNVLHAWLEGGLLSALCMIGALTWLLQRWARLHIADPERYAPAGAILLSYLVIGFTAFGLWQSWWMASGFLSLALWKFSPTSIKHT